MVAARTAKRKLAVAEFDVTIGFIGAGNMGEAFIGAVIQSGLLPAAKISVADADAGRLGYLKKRYGVTVLRDNGSLFQSCRMVVLAVKPQQMPAVLKEVSGQRGYRLPERKLVISIAAGFATRKMDVILIPAGCGKCPEPAHYPGYAEYTGPVFIAVSGMSPNRFVTEEDARAARTLLQAVGDVIEFEEEALDAVTALSGSGPAYVFYLVESMTEAGIQMGLEPGAAALLAAATLRGSAKLLEASGEPPEELRRKVTSPGGTTAAAIDVFEKRGFKSIVVAAIASATRRAQELSG